MPELTPAQRSLRSRQAALTSWAGTENWSERTEPARRSFLDRFDKQVDPNGELPPEIRVRRAAAARRAYFIGLAIKSAEARRRGRSKRPSLPPQGRRDSATRKRGGES